MVKGTLVLIDSSDMLDQKVNEFGREMSVFGNIVKEFHGKLMLTGSDEKEGLIELKKFTNDKWVPIFFEEDNEKSGKVLFPVNAMRRVSYDLFCEDNLEDVVLIKRRIWFHEKFGNDLSINKNQYENIDQLFKFHGKVLRVDWNETGKLKKGYRVLKKFTNDGWVDILVEEGNPDSGYLLFHEDFLNDFIVDIFFQDVAYQ
jgi:hypothetical protein